MVFTWDPDANSTVGLLFLDGTNIFAGGTFTRFKSTVRSYGSIIRISTGVASSWNPMLDYIGYDVAYNNAHIYVAGLFHNANAISHNCVASFNITTGALETWNPHLKLNGSVVQGTGRALYATNTDVYIGGSFDTSGTTKRNNFVSVSVATAAINSINPSPDNTCYAFGLNGTQLIMGGQFIFLNATLRNYCALIRHSTGKVNAFDPGLDYIVYDQRPQPEKLLLY